MLLPLHGFPGKTDIGSMSADEVTELIKEYGQPAFRAKQLFSGAAAGIDPKDISTLPLALRSSLSEKYGVCTVEIVKRQTASDGTEKYLYRLGDGAFVEGVFMRYHHGNTLCISTQVGCRMGCAFCASCLDGLSRGLNPSEMLGEIRAAEQITGERVGGIVMMGTGEPLDNYDASVSFIKRVSEQSEAAIGQRHISLSTSGIVPKIYELEKEQLGITLSISLHATTNEIRSRLMPVNRKWPLEELIAAATHYQQTTGRRVSYEYAMIRDINDTPADAQRLSSLLSGRGAHVNLIRLNEIKESPFHPSTPETLKTFMDILENNHINATLRRRLGKEIDGACGQLRRKHASN